MSTTLIDNYQTDNSNNIISLTVTIGYAQKGSTAITIAAQPYVVKPPANGNNVYVDSFTVALGTNVSLKGKVMQVVSVVARIQPTPNSSVTYALTSNGNTVTFPPLGGTLTNLGDVLQYLAMITFI